LIVVFFENIFEKNFEISAFCCNFDEMSFSMKGILADRAKLFHILDAIYEIESYVGNAAYEDFINNSMMRTATVKQLEILGNATNKLSPELKIKYPFMPWEFLASYKYMLIHEYFGINYELVWITAKFEVHKIKENFENILEEYLNEYGAHFD